MTIQSLVLTDNVETATLTDGTNYALAANGWSPQVAQLRANALGGVGAYEQVEEKISIDILSTPRSLSATLANVAKLQSLIEKAAQWSNGETTQPVQLQITMAGGNTLAALVYGGALDLPSNYADYLPMQEVAVATLRVVRAGSWSDLSLVNTIVTAQPNPFELTGTLPALASRSPVRLWITGFSSSTPAVNTPLMYVAVSKSLGVLEAETSLSRVAPGGGAWTTVADAAALARGGSVARTSGAAGTYTVTYSAGSLVENTRYAVFAAVRKTTASEAVTITMRALRSQAVTNIAAPVIVSTASTAPLIVPLGVVAGRLGIDRIELTIQRTQTTNFDLDYLIVVDVTQSAAAVLSLGAVAQVYTGAGVETATYAIDATDITSATPRVSAETSNIRVLSLSYNGSPDLSTTGGAFYVCVFGTHGTYWRIMNNIAVTPVVANLGVTFAALPSYVVPR